MLKVVVFDSGYGGELFADQLEKELPVVEVIRVIDWRHADEIQSNPKTARKAAKAALRPYIGKVDLIIFANLLLTLTSLKHFRRQYKNQKFLGLNLPHLDPSIKQDLLILATKPITKTISYYNFIFHLKQKNCTLALDSWPAKIDDGELTQTEISHTLHEFLRHRDYRPQGVILACSHFSDIKIELRASFGHNLRIYDSFSGVISQVCKTLKIRGGTGKKNK